MYPILNELILSTTELAFIKRTLCFNVVDSDYNYYDYRQNITITTSEEKWLELMNENV